MKLISKLIIIITLVLSGCASKPTDPQDVLKDNMQVMRDAVIKVVTHEKRRNNLLISIKKLEKTLLTYNEAYADFAVEFRKLNKQYHTPRKKLEQLLTSFALIRKTTIHDVVKLHFAMVAQTNKDEWKRIVKHELEALESVRQFPQGVLGETS